jgi:putative transposase
VYVTFIIDVYSRMMVGWQASRSLHSDLASDALEMVVWNRQRAGADLEGLVHHSDRGVQYLSIRYSERLAENEIVASVGAKGDTFENAMPEPRALRSEPSLADAPPANVGSVRNFVYVVQMGP